MKTLSPNELVEAQKWRYAVKVFDAAKKIPAAEWKALEDSLVLTPSSYGLQPWKFLDIQDIETRKKLRAHSWNQSQVTDASHYVVFLGREDITPADLDKFVECMAQAQKKDAASFDAYRKMMMQDLVDGPRHAWIREWVSRQVYIALGNFMTSAAVIGVDTCPMEGLDPDKYDEVLGLKGSGYSTRVACAAGYRSASDKYASTPKARYPKNELIKRI
jgi:nitroreductase